jgi:D-alanyl-D-alanine carboxypeptidase/D-alanyl-D-alanine-endopeptidase (penicillin-binding protein 4)
MIRRAVAGAAILALALSASAGGLDEEIEGLVGKHGLKEGGAVGVCVAPLAGGEVLGGRRADETFPLASVTKMYTAAAALEILGPSHAFRTRVWWVKGGEAGDTLVAVGCGDPGISGRDHGGNPAAVFDDWAAQLKAAGLRKVARLELDATRFDDPGLPEGWPKDQLSEWYCAPPGALAFNDNCIDVSVGPGDADGAPARVALSPATTFFTVDNRCVTTSDKAAHVISIDRKPGGNVLQIRGKCLLKAAPLTESVAVQDPAAYFGHVLREALVRAGLDAADAKIVRRAEPFDPASAAGWPVVHETTLQNALRVMLRRSQNLYAEQILRACSSRSPAMDSGLRDGLKALSSVGVAEGDLAWLDGSGLTRGNRASPAAVVRFLQAAAKRPWFESFRGSLAAPGEPGTLEKRLPSFRKTLRAKTGSISGVSNLAGIVDTPRGPVAFCILVSQLKIGNTATYNLQEDLLKVLTQP